MAGIIYNAVRSVVQFIYRVIRRALGCFSRRKKSQRESLNLTEIGIVPNEDEPEDLIMWSSWDDIPIIVTDCGPKPTDSVQLKIDEYRERKLALQNETDSVEAIDYFEDMAPKITKQEKILVPGAEVEEYVPSSSLLADPYLPSPELGVWEESGQWEDSPNDWSMFEILRDIKKEEEMEKAKDQAKKKQGKDSQSRRSAGFIKLT